MIWMSCFVCVLAEGVTQFTSALSKTGRVIFSFMQ